MNPNHARFDAAATGGFYESYFQRANHPARPLAFWIRYTLFAPKDRPSDAIGELWAVWSDGERGVVVAAKSEVPAGQFAFARDRFHARVGDAVLEPGRLVGAAHGAQPGPQRLGTYHDLGSSRYVPNLGGHRIDWDLTYTGGQPPLLLLPAKLYEGAFPKAKSLVGVPMAAYSGRIKVDGEVHEIANWIGSQNHNWGSRHTDRYAYGQVCGFDNAPNSFLEIATGQLKLGPFWTPRMTPLVLRHEGEEYALTSVAQAVLKARGRWQTGTEQYQWHFASRTPEIAIEGEISAPNVHFVELRYFNPPGGTKACFNSKIASCRLSVKRAGRAEQVLETQHSAAFEILS